MPTVHRIGRLAIRVFPQDHEPPHVHLYGPGFSLRLFLGSWRQEVVHGRPRGHEAAVAWAKANEAALRAAWKRTRPSP
jgi:hypothetical protein